MRFLTIRVPDGKIAVDIRPKPVLPVSVLFNYTNRGTILYAGPAPGMIAGVLQINVRVLDVQCIEPNCFPDFSAIPVVIAIGPPDPNNWNSFGKYTSSGFATIAVRQ